MRLLNKDKHRVRPRSTNGKMPSLGQYQHPFSGIRKTLKGEALITIHFEENKADSAQKPVYFLEPMLSCKLQAGFALRKSNSDEWADSPRQKVENGNDWHPIVDMIAARSTQQSFIGSSLLCCLF